MGASAPAYRIMKNEVREKFIARFGREPSCIGCAPGRLEILGNHTDYNQGTVLSVAVDRYILFAAAPTEGTLCTLADADFGEDKQFDIGNFGPHVKGDWSGYVKGMVLALRKRGVDVPAFNAVLRGNVPLSAGMSSSAALEMSVGLALCSLAGKELPWLEMAKAGQECENTYIGANTGLLDQFSSLRGKADCLIYSDFRTLETSTIAMPAGYAFVVINSMVKHFLTNEYNDRRVGCQKALEHIAKRIPGVKALRDVSMAQVEECASGLDAVSYGCAKHVVGEIERVAAGIACLNSGDIVGFGQLMFQSHESSRLNFKNSCDELDEIVALAKANPLCLGARLSGGGFGGISVHLVKAGDANAYAKTIVEQYRRKTGATLQDIICVPSDGAALI